MISALTATSYYMFLIVILLLLIIGLYVYFKSKLSKQNRTFVEIANKSKESEKNKNALLLSLGDDIFQLTQTLVNPEETKDEAFENNILTSANNLRELLKIQANNIDVYSEKFVFYNLLEDISTYMSSNFEKINTEVIYDIDFNVPRYLIGDSIHFSRIINNLLEFSIQSSPHGKVILAITSDKVRVNDIILNVEIRNNGNRMSKEVLNRLFTLNYNNKKEEQASIRLYIARKLTLAIGGTIEVNSKMPAGNIFTLQVPMKCHISSNLQEFSSIKKDLEDKKVLIYSDKIATGLSLKKLFSYFYTEVALLSKEELDKNSIDVIHFDLLIFDDTFFTRVGYEQLKEKKEVKHFHIIVFSSIFSKNKANTDTLIDAYMHTPSSLECITELLGQLELTPREEICTDDGVPAVNISEINKGLQVHKLPIEEAKNIDIDCFTYFKGSRVLIVEDNMINQKIIVSVLKQSGMEMEIANNGQEALDLLFHDKKQFDIVLMDISMPVMDGLMATQRIREKNKYDTIPIITFTAFAMGVEIDEMFNAGANAYITKPLNIKKLYNVFYMFLSQTKREVSIQKEIQIEGLDIEVGIYNADESEVLYRETLKEFVLVYQDMVQLVPKWLKEKRYERVKLACTQLQGILAAIGAYELKELVDEIQKNFLYNNEEFLDKYILLFPEKLNNLIETIQRYLAK